MCQKRALVSSILNVETKNAGLLMEAGSCPPKDKQHRDTVPSAWSSVLLVLAQCTWVDVRGGVVHACLEALLLRNGKEAKIIHPTIKYISIYFSSPV